MITSPFFLNSNSSEIGLTPITKALAERAKKIKEYEAEMDCLIKYPRGADARFKAWKQKHERDL